MPACLIAHSAPKNNNGSIKTNPFWALGQLERVAHHLALIQSQNQDQAVTQLAIHQPTVLVLTPITASLSKVSGLRQVR